MPASPEREYPIVEHIDNPTVSGADARETGMEVNQGASAQLPAQVTHNGQVIAQSTAPASVSITVPADNPGALGTASSGSHRLSLTWWAVWWVRMVKKAVRAGVGVVYKRS